MSELQAWLRQRGELQILPIVHGRLDSAVLVRAVLEQLRPRRLALDLPASILEAARRAAARLPRLSVVVSGVGEELSLWIVAPGDPLAEALRWAVGRDVEIVALDDDLPGRERKAPRLADSSGLLEAGPEGLAASVEAAAKDLDPARCRAQAFRLRQLEGASLALLGVDLVEGVLAALEQPLAEPFSSSKREVSLYDLDRRSPAAVLADPPLLHAAFARRLEPLGSPPDIAECATAPPRLELFGAFLVLPGIDPARGRDAHLVNAAAACFDQVCGLERPCRRRFQQLLFAVACRSWEALAGETVRPWQRQVFTDFAGRYARRQGLIHADLYTQVVAARGAVDDDLAWELFDAGRCYPAQAAPAADLPSARIDGEMLDFGTHQVRFRRMLRGRRPRLRAIKGREERDLAGEAKRWLELLDGESICSWPPEDIRIEGWTWKLGAKGESVIRAETATSEPFSTSLLDGIDLRQTLRHWHEGRVWVRSEGRLPAPCNAVVVIFEDEPLEGTHFPYLMTWLGEHDQESDMAFYATEPGQRAVGPGILKSSYGGFLMMRPRGSMPEIWSEDFGRASSKAEQLLLAAIELADSDLVVHVGPSAPSSHLKHLAARRGRRLMHLPIGSLEPAARLRMRTVHLLFGKKTRDTARPWIRP